jgi:hypothetical protein
MSPTPTLSQGPDSGGKPVRSKDEGIMVELRAAPECSTVFCIQLCPFQVGTEPPRHCGQEQKPYDSEDSGSHQQSA